MHLPTLTPLVLLVALVAACDPAPEQPPAPTIDPEQMGMLDRLGYVDFGTRVDEDTGVTIFDPSRSHPGLNLITYPPLGRAEIVDVKGNVLHSWSSELEGARWERARILPGGDLLVISHPGGLVRMSPDGETRWTWDREHDHFHHFADALPDGRIIGLALTRRWRLGYSRLRVIDDSVAILSIDGEMLERHFLLDVSSRNREHDLARDPERGVRKRAAVDIFHTNRIHWITEGTLDEPHPLMKPGRLLLTVRNQDSLVLLDWKTQKVLWTWGRGVLGLPHDGQVLANGHVIVFDNRGDPAGSRVLEIDPLRDEIVWSYQPDDPSDFLSKTRGTVQRLAGGTTLVAESNEGRAFEVDHDGAIVWEYRTPHRDDEGRPATLRLDRYPAEALAPVWAAVGEPAPIAEPAPMR